MSTNRIAVMKFSALGDIAATLPLLRQMVPSPTIITSPLGHAFLKDEFSDFLIFPDKTVKSHFEIIQKVRKAEFSDLVDLQGNDRCRFFGKAMTLLTRTAYHNGYDRNSKYQSFSPMIDKVLKEIEAGRTYQPRPADYIVLNTGSSAKWSAKRPPPWKWVEFSKILHSRFACAFKLTGSDEEFEYVSSIAEQIPFDTEVVAGKTSLADLKVLLREAFLTVSTDSAAMHISAAEGTPTIGIFGSTTTRSIPKPDWAVPLYDRTFYPTGELPKCTDVIDSYYDKIDLTEGLDRLTPYLTSE